MNILKKNQVIIYTFALMLVAAGYLNYTSSLGEKSVETSIDDTIVQEEQVSAIGDARLVNSDDIVNENVTDESSISTEQNSIETNTTLDEENNKTSTENNSSDDYFVQSKLERDTMYSQMIENYEKILNSSNSLETRKTISYTGNYKNK